MFDIFLTVIIVGYVLYYAYQIVSDIFFKKEVKEVSRAEEQDVDISDEVSNFASEKVERPGTSRQKATMEDDNANVVNSGAIEVSDLMKHIDAFAKGEEFGELQFLSADWEASEAA